MYGDEVYKVAQGKDTWGNPCWRVLDARNGETVTCKLTAAAAYDAADRLNNARSNNLYALRAGMDVDDL